MKYQTLVAASTCLAALSLQSEIITFRLSPPGTTAAVGLSPANEVPPVTTSEGSGGEIFTGITFDTETKILDFSIGYGSFAGFTDLTGEATAAHIHGPAGTEENNSPVYDFVANMTHLPAPNPAHGGVIIGAVELAGDQEVSDLTNGLYYVNIHTAANSGGELRAQLIAVYNEPPTLTCPDAVVAECESPDGTLVTLVTGVGDPDGDPMTVTWTIDGIVYQVDEVPASDGPTLTELELNGIFGVGPHDIAISVEDGVYEAVVCVTSVMVVDTVPPVVNSATARPALLWPPNHKMVPVRLRLDVDDACGPVTNTIVSVTSNEPDDGIGDGNTIGDWEITGDLSLLLRAERSGNGGGRVYTITVESVDVVGNTTMSTVEVVVPHDRGKGGKRGRSFTGPSDDPDDDDAYSQGNGKGKGKKNKKAKNHRRP